MYKQRRLWVTQKATQKARGVFAKKYAKGLAVQKEAAEAKVAAMKKDASKIVKEGSVAERMKAFQKAGKRRRKSKRRRSRKKSRKSRRKSRKSRRKSKRRRSRRRRR